MVGGFTPPPSLHSAELGSFWPQKAWKNFIRLLDMKEGGGDGGRVAREGETVWQSKDGNHLQLHKAQSLISSQSSPSPSLDQKLKWDC